MRLGSFPFLDFFRSTSAAPHAGLTDAAEVKRLRDGIEEICEQRATSPITRARLRHLKAGVDWRKAK